MQTRVAHGMSAESTDLRDAMLAVSEMLTSHRFVYGDEKDLQAAIELLLKRRNVAHIREKETGSGPIDFLLTEFRIGIEVKVKGSPSEVVRQLIRYAESTEIEGILLVTTKSSLSRFVPSFLSGKPAGVVSLWKNGF